MSNEELRIYAEDAEDVIRHLNTTALKSLSGSGQHPDKAIVEVRNVSRRFLDNAKNYAALSATSKSGGNMTPVEALAEIRDRLLNHSEAERSHLLAVDLPSLIDGVIGRKPEDPSKVVSLRQEPGLLDLPF